MSKRVYHPTGNAWQDVPEGDVDAWAEAGWRKTKPKHVNDAEALPPGVGDSVPVTLATVTEEPADVAKGDSGKTGK